MNEEKDLSFEEGFAQMAKEQERDPLDTKMDEIPWSSRVAKILHYGKISTLRELTAKSPKDLHRLRNFGKKSLEEVQRYLSSRGLSLLGETADLISLQSAYDRMSQRVEELRRELIYQDEQARRSGVVTKTNTFEPMTVSNQIEVEFKDSDGTKRGVFQFVREGRL